MGSGSGAVEHESSFSLGTIPERTREAEERVGESAAGGGGGGEETLRRGGSVRTKMFLLSVSSQIFHPFLFVVSAVQERRILEETVAPLSPSVLLRQQSGHTGTASSGNNNVAGGNVSLQQNGQKVEDQHTSKLLFFQGQFDARVFADMQKGFTFPAWIGVHETLFYRRLFADSSCDGEPSKKQELWKTASLDRNPQLPLTQSVKRSVK